MGVRVSGWVGSVNATVPVACNVFIQCPSSYWILRSAGQVKLFINSKFRLTNSKFETRNLLTPKFE